MHAIRHRRAAIATVAIAAAVLTGSAAAFWASNGGGAAGNPAATTAAVTLSQGTTAGTLVPGGSADVAVSITNSNPSRIFVGSLSLDTSQGTSGFAVDGGHAGCNLAALSFTTQTNGGAGWFVAASSTQPLDLTGSVSLSTAAVSACQGAQITVYLKAGP
jgi:hypothetical protein